MHACLCAWVQKYVCAHVYTHVYTHHARHDARTEPGFRRVLSCRHTCLHACLHTCVCASTRLHARMPYSYVGAWPKKKYRSPRETTHPHTRSHRRPAPLVRRKKGMGYRPVAWCAGQCVRGHCVRAGEAWARARARRVTLGCLGAGKYHAKAPVAPVFEHVSICKPICVPAHTSMHMPMLMTQCMPYAHTSRPDTMPVAGI